MTLNRIQSPALHIIDKPDLAFPDLIRLDNGIPVYLLHAGSTEVTKLEFVFNAGTWNETTPLQAAICNSMLQEGSQNYSSAVIADLFDFHGSYLQLAVDQHFGVVSLVALNKHLPKLLPVLEDLIKHSVFPEHEFQTLMKRRKQRFLLENQKVKVLAQKKFSQVLFGNKHPYAQTVKSSDYDELTVADLLVFYKKQYHSGNCKIVASGLMDENLCELLNQYFGKDDWKGECLSEKQFEIRTSPERIHRVEKKDAIQSAIRVGKIMVGKDHPDFCALQVLATILGGHFTSRLMLNIREDKGYTYGIGAYLLNFREAGYLAISTETDKKYVEATLEEIFKEIKKLREELVGEEELELVKQYLLGEFIRDFDGPFARSTAFRSVHDFDLDYGFYEDYYQTLLSINPIRLNGLANKYLGDEDFYQVIAGS